MSILTKNLKQLLILTNNNAIGAAASYFLTIYLANYFGAEGFGNYSYILVVSSISSIFINYSTDQTASTMAAKQIAVQDIFNLVFCIRIVFFMLSFLSVSFWYHDQLQLILGVFCLNLFSLNLGYLFEVEQKNAKYSFVYLSERLCYIGLISILLYFSPQKLTTVFIVYVLVTFGSLSYQYGHFWHIVRNFTMVKWKEAKQLLADNLYLVVIALSSYVYGGISRIFIEDKLGMKMLGIFSSGMQITSLITIFQAQVDKVWRLPIYTSISNRNLQAIKREVMNYIKTSTLPSLFFCLMLAVFGGALVKILFNSSYAELGSVMPQISFFFVLINLSSLCAILWVGLHALREYLIISVTFSLILLIVLYFMPNNISLKIFISGILLVQALSILYSCIRLIFRIKKHVHRSYNITN